MRFALVPLIMLCAGCIKPEFIANKAGFLAGTGYLAVNAPPPDEVKAVRSVVDKIAKYTDRLEPKETFAKLFAPIREEIEAELSGVTKTLAISVARMSLDQLDMLFMANPKWAENKDLVISVTRAFADGIQGAFDLFAGNEEVRASMVRVKAAAAAAYRQE